MYTFLSLKCVFKSSWKVFCDKTVLMLTSLRFQELYEIYTTSVLPGKAHKPGANCCPKLLPCTITSAQSPVATWKCNTCNYLLLLSLVIQMLAAPSLFLISWARCSTPLQSLLIHSSSGHMTLWRHLRISSHTNWPITGLGVSYSSYFWPLLYSLICMGFSL